MAVKDVLVEHARRARVWTVDRWGAFRAESPYFQGKVGLVALYLVVVSLTILLVPPDGEPWAAKQERISFGLAFKTALEVSNFDSGNLEDVVLEVRGKGIEFDGKEIPGIWRTKPMLLIEGRPTKILTEQLFSDIGLNPPYSLVVDTITVIDDDKDVLVVLHPTTAAERAAAPPAED